MDWNDNTVPLKKCPIGEALKYVGAKWGINIIRDMFLGKNRFRDFLHENPGLSTKMLSQRLKDLEKKHIIEKNIVSKSPVIANCINLGTFFLQFAILANLTIVQ